MVRPRVGAVARTVQIDLVYAERPAQIVDVVRALDGVVVVRIDAALPPVRAEPFGAVPVCGEEAVAGSARLPSRTSAGNGLTKLGSAPFAPR